jgi:hypothetical protein
MSKEDLLAKLQGRCTPPAANVKEQRAIKQKLKELCSEKPVVVESRRRGFLDQLAGVAEAQHILDIAWKAGEFEDCVVRRPSPFLGVEGGVVHDEDWAMEESLKRVKDRAYELLADQYPELKIRVRRPSKWSGTRAEQASWLLVLAGREEG